MQWKKKYCDLHQSYHGVGSCVCHPPFELFPFPTFAKDRFGRERWIKLVNRKKSDDEGDWIPNENSRICSEHFPDGRPTRLNPDPVLNLINVTQPKSVYKLNDAHSKDLGAVLNKRKSQDKENCMPEKHTCRHSVCSVRTSEAHRAPLKPITVCDVVNHESDTESATSDVYEGTVGCYVLPVAVADASNSEFAMTDTYERPSGLHSSQATDTAETSVDTQVQTLKQEMLDVFQQLQHLLLEVQGRANESSTEAVKMSSDLRPGQLLTTVADLRILINRRLQGLSDVAECVEIDAATSATSHTSALPTQQTTESDHSDHSYFNGSHACAAKVNCFPVRPKYQSFQISKSKLGYTTDKCQQFISTDRMVKEHTGLTNKQTLTALYRYLAPKAAGMRYWHGAKYVSSKVKNHYRGAQGRSRKLSIKSELVLVLMKIRLGLTNSFLACLFGISISCCSSIVNTWIKFLAYNLKPLVFWPDREAVNKLIPKSLKTKYPKLRCTLDCSETFIQRPRDLYLQATTWSDYKHHNTLKYLVAIAPNGHISFISSAWGGRTTDRYIVQQCGILRSIDPGDIVLADRGFTIQEDLLFCQASLVIPPPSSGKCQMTTANVVRTKQVANARIHVERAINRLKWFKLLSSVVPVSLVPLFDDVLVICAALCNLLPPLVT